jgi:hypothetical protein
MKNTMNYFCKIWHKHEEFTKEKNVTLRTAVGNKFYYTFSCGLGQRSQYSNSLWATYSRNQVKWLGVGDEHSAPSSAKAKSRTELYLLIPNGPSWQILGQTLPFIHFPTKYHRTLLVWRNAAYLYVSIKNMKWKQTKYPNWYKSSNIMVGKQASILFTTFTKHLPYNR